MEQYGIFLIIFSILAILFLVFISVMLFLILIKREEINIHIPPMNVLPNSTDPNDKAQDITDDNTGKYELRSTVLEKANPALAGDVVKDVVEGNNIGK